LWLNCSLAGAMVVTAALLFGLAWVFSPTHGLIRQFLRRQAIQPPEEAAASAVR
jgi:manganese/zinc/iron transport system permease protein